MLNKNALLNTIEKRIFTKTKCSTEKYKKTQTETKNSQKREIEDIKDLSIKYC